METSRYRKECQGQVVGNGAEERILGIFCYLSESA